MKKQLIKDLKIGDEVETQALVAEVNRSPFASPHRSGEFFLKLTLADVSGRVKAVMWDPPVGEEEIKSDDIVFVRGSVGEYHGPQVVVSDMRKLDPTKVNKAFFQPVAERDPREMLGELKEIIEQEVKDPQLKGLLEKFLGDAEFARSFALAPAARTIHHNYVSGLLEHTLEVIEICRNLVRIYPGQLRFDLLIAGAVLHDIGKIEEYKQESISFDFTDRGKLVGHISIGKEMLDKKLAEMPDFPEALKLELQHIMLTHHGMREWGSPEVPKTIHAFALFHADLVSARMNQFINVMQKHVPESGDWTEWDRFLERSVYVPPEE
ncbi:MAG: HD domain-containing protein [Bacillota bacterium]|nr:HD domain-containing protein [Bacillota bacterium]